MIINLIAIMIVLIALENKKRVNNNSNNNLHVIAAFLMILKNKFLLNKCKKKMKLKCQILVKFKNQKALVKDLILYKWNQKLKLIMISIKY